MVIYKMKSYTNLEQSRKLAEILPIESADFHFSANQSPKGYLEKPIWGNPEYADYNALPCWSLSALLDMLNYPTLAHEFCGSEKEKWFLSMEDLEGTYRVWENNPVDACVEMIYKLKDKYLV